MEKKELIKKVLSIKRNLSIQEKKLLVKLKRMIIYKYMKSVTIYTGPLCNFCDAAKRLLARNNVEYKEINIATVDGAMDEMITKANGKRTIPQIFFDDQHIGGYDDVRALEKENKLQDLLK